MVLGVPILKHFRVQSSENTLVSAQEWCILWNSCLGLELLEVPNFRVQLSILYTVKILKFGTPQTIAIIVLEIEKFDLTLH